MREPTVRKRVSLLLALIVLGCTTVTLAACNTTRGAGEDISAAGHAISNTAQNVKNKM